MSDREQAKKIANDFVNKGFDQFDLLPENLPFKEDVEEAFGSLYMVTREVVMYMQEGGSISIPEIKKLNDEWQKCMQIRELVELVGDQYLQESWEKAVLDSYYDILHFVSILQEMFEENYNKDE